MYTYIYTYVMSMNMTMENLPNCFPMIRPIDSPWSWLQRRQGATKMEPDVPLLPLSKRESMLIIISFSTANLRIPDACGQTPVAVIVEALTS